jgi:hypothetical protein
MGLRAWIGVLRERHPDVIWIADEAACRPTIANEADRDDTDEHSLILARALPAVVVSA